MRGKARGQRGVAGCSGKPLKFIQSALDPLVTGGWLEPETEYPSNRAWTLVDGVAITLRMVAGDRVRAVEGVGFAPGSRDFLVAIAACSASRRRIV
jgi:hypothetical protein